MASSIVFITGANAGLGLGTVRSLFRSSRTYTVLLGSRSLAKADVARQQLQAEFPNSSTTVAPVQIDVEDDESIQKAFEHISAQYDRVDVLVNNAGQFESQMLAGDMTMRQLWNQSWNVNTTGTQILTHTFVPLLLQSSDPRLLFITSGTSTLTETDNLALPLNQSPTKGWPKPSPSLGAYRSSKTGLNMLMREWARILKEDGVKTWCVSPGFLATGLGGNQERNRLMGAIDPTMGADFVRDVIEGTRDRDIGQAIRRDGVQPW
ncbi:hypothetical protein N7492_002145 [Penicillium capsulatum]|uniref:Uncharacterized protein n=1 Tax=Penicillium capsulatum TaxID=69766 RepID=A0A9W9IKX5_9EURO|nr:hypothetical protein N7492_002145 [Penicillium capsulatum]KAJ6123245.1 hypothetical protein N7512_005710 [Penicillium capsulatum]